MAEREQETAAYPVVADRPVELHNPVRRARIAVVLLVAGIMAAAAAGGWFGYEMGARHTDARISALERDQQQRAAARNGEIRQLRETACVILDRLPPGPDVDRQRELFGCGPHVPLESSGPPASPGAAPRTGGATSPRAGGPSAVPRPAPNTSPAPRPSPGGHLLCLPVVGCVG